MRRNKQTWQEVLDMFMAGNVELYGDILVKMCLPHGEYVKLIGEGGEKLVILFKDTLLNQQRLLQIQLPSLGLVEEKRFFRSARILTKISHDEIKRGNVPPFSIVYMANESPAFLIVEYIDGINLRDYLATQPELGINERLKIFKDLGYGLYKMHQNGIVHRDIKPDNCIVDDRGMPRWIDFGISMSIYENPLTRTDQVLGTPLYAAPEQMSDAANVDGRADIYSFGRLLFFILTNDESFNPELLPWEVMMVYSRATQSCIERRYSCAREMLEDLAESYPDAGLLNDVNVAAYTEGVSKAMQELAILTSINPGKMKKMLGCSLVEWDQLLLISKNEIVGHDV